MTPQTSIAEPEPAAGPAAPVLDVIGLCKRFRVNGGSITVLEQIDFRATKGEFICILGKSGCGKSTLLKILAGFIPPSSGRVILNGDIISAPGPDRCVVFQEDALFPWLTVQENIAFGLRHQDKQRVRSDVSYFLSLMGLSEFGDYLPGEISGGMKQRVALARVLILDPLVLLMDEPFASLDSQTREDMQNLLLLLWKKMYHTIVFVTHDVGEAVVLADRILIMDMDPGRIREDVRVNLPRPRKKGDRDYLLFCRYICERLSG